MRQYVFLVASTIALAARADAASDVAHRVLIQGNGKLAVVEADGRIDWEIAWGPIHDIHRLANGHIMVQRDFAAVVEIDPDSKSVVWEYDATKQPETKGQPLEIHSFQPLANGRVMIAESGPGRIIEIDRDGKTLKAVKLKLDHPDPHRDTRLVRKLANGNYLACHEGDGAVREYDGQSGAVVWEYAVPLFGREPREGHGPDAFGNQAFAAVRLDNGDTLIATGNGHSVLRVTPAKQIAWKLDQHDLPGITLAWCTTLDVLPNGHYVIGNCHAGADNPQIIEIEPAMKKVLWTFNRYDEFGNDVSNTLLLDIKGHVLR